MRASHPRRPADRSPQRDALRPLWPVALVAPALILLSPLAERAFGASGLQAQEQNASYVLRYSESSGEGDQTTEMRIYVQGPRTRMDASGQGAYTLVQCDHQRMVSVVPSQDFCCVTPLGGGGAALVGGGRSGQPGATRPDTVRGGVVEVESEFRDTGERKEILGAEARRVITRQVAVADSNACAFEPGRSEMRMEAWIADVELPQLVQIMSCSPEPPDPEEYLANSYPTCRDEVSRTISGDPDLLSSGTMVAGTTVTTEGNERTRTSFEITDLEYGPQDSALFRVPEGCSCPYGLAPAPENPATTEAEGDRTDADETAETDEEDEAGREDEETPPPEDEEELTGVAVEETDSGVKLDLSADVLFEFDEWELRPEARDVLQRVGDELDRFPDGRITVEGHTDALGREDYNLRLGERRAEAVRDWLVETAGVAAERIETRSWGETRPVAANTNPDGTDNPEGRRQNRRVEIRIESATSLGEGGVNHDR